MKTSQVSTLISLFDTGNDIRKWARNSETFYELIKKSEDIFGKRIQNFSLEEINLLHDLRIKQLVKVANLTEQYSNVHYECLEDLSTFPILDRNHYSTYMDPSSGLGFPLGFNHLESWKEGLSGGTTAGPIVTRITWKDQLSTAMQTANNLAFWLSSLGVEKNVWSYILNRPSYDAAFSALGFVYHSYKATSFEDARNALVSWNSQCVMGTAYSVYKQLEILSEGFSKWEECMNHLRAAIYGGEFMSTHMQRKLLNFFPQLQLISRYISSQTGYGILGLGMSATQRFQHVLDQGVCRFLVVDKTGHAVDEGQWGELVVLNLHMTAQPVLGVRLGDEAKIYHDDKGNLLLDLAGRVDDIVIFNTQKIFAEPILEEAIKIVANTYPDNILSGVAQLVKKHGGSVIIKLESSNTSPQICQEEFNRKITSHVYSLAKSMSLPADRTVEGVTFTLELVKINSIARVGYREKVKKIIDESIL